MALVQDLKVAFRTLVSKPMFSLTVIGMLSVGIAGNSSIFSIFNGLFLRPLPFDEADRLVDLDETAPHAIAGAPLRWHKRSRAEPQEIVLTYEAAIVDCAGADQCHTDLP